MANNNKKHASWFNRLFWLIPLLLIIGGGYYYFQNQQQQKNQPQYVTSTVKRGDIAINVLATGQVQPFSQVNIGAQASGQISKLYVALGDAVKKGQIIAELNPETQDNELNKAQAQLKNNQTSLTVQKANLAQALKNLKRQEMMFAEDATSKQALENAQTQVKTSQANLTQAKLQIEQSRIALNKAKLDRSYTTVKSPNAGIVIALPVQAGQTINAVQTSPTIATIARLDKMKVKLEISEADISKVKAGMPTHFTIIGDTRRYDSVLKNVDPAPTSISNNSNSQIASGTPIYYYGTLEVPNSDGSLRMYMTANAVIAVKQAKDVLMIPTSALSAPANEKNEASVTVLTKTNNEKIQRTNTKTVTLGLNDGINVQVLSGLTENDTIVISQTDPNKQPDGMEM